MNYKKLSLLLTSTLFIAGCGNNPGVDPEPVDPEPVDPVKDFLSAKNFILTKHNYSAHLVNQWEDETAPWAEFNFYNIDNNVMYDDIYLASEGCYEGYIKQKNQGIVSFTMYGSSLGVGAFATTNVNLGITDIYQLTVEGMLSGEYTYSEEKGVYVSTDRYSKAVLANLAFGGYTQLVSDSLDITAKYENDSLVFTADYGVTYFDIVEVNTTAHVTVTVSNLGKTRNEVLENYVANPDYTYVAPTEWSNGAKECFDEDYNGYYPPFIEGLSYSWKYGRGVSEGNYTVRVEDYWAGDLTTDYARILEREGFTPVTNPAYVEYVKTVEDELLIHKYSVKMKFYAPTDKDSDGMEYGFLFPNGVSSFNFLHKQTTKSAVNTVKALNEYIASTTAGAYLPKITLDDSIKVSNFKDASDVSAEDSLYLKGESTQYFYIYADTKANAIKFVEEYVAALKLIGLDGKSNSSFQEYWMSDDYDSTIHFTDPSYVNNWEAGKSKISMWIRISKTTLERWQSEVVELESISVSGQTTTFYVGDTFTFDGEVTAHYSNGTSKVVTPTNVVAPDMNVASEQTVLVTYVEDGKTVSTSYLVEIKTPETEYNIVVPLVEHGSVRVSMPSSLKAKAGSTVIFSVIADNGYEIEEVSVTSNGQKVEVTGPNSSGACSFVMPNGDANISVTIVPEVARHTVTYVVKDTDSNVLNFNDVIDSTSTLPTTVKEGNNSFNIVTRSGYTFSSASVGEDAVSASFDYEVTSDITVIIIVSVDQGGGGEGGDKGDVSLLKGTFTCQMNSSYTYKFTFDGEGNGVFSYLNSLGEEKYPINFTYTVNSETKAVSITLDPSTSTTTLGKYLSTYQIVNKTLPSSEWVNSTGIINSDGSFTITFLKLSAGTWSSQEPSTFKKVS